MSEFFKAAAECSIWKDEAGRLIDKARKEGICLAWDRLERQTPQCNVCDMGLSCSKCVMGPCRIIPGLDRDKGVCGAGADLTVARNFGRFVAGGSAAHSDHGRDLVEVLYEVGAGKAPGYSIRDEAKLRRIAAEVGVDAEGDATAVAKRLAERLGQDYSSFGPGLAFLSRLPKARRELWDRLDLTPRGIDREPVEMLHRTHMGVDCDPVSLCLHAARVSLADGWGGSMSATEISDIIFGTPAPVKTRVNLGAIRKDMVNILVHGHSPVVSEMILLAAADPENVKAAKDAGASGINVAGLCCTGNELLMRRGVPLAGNHMMTELTMMTGAVEAIVADYQCIMPSLTDVAACFHTKFITTSEKGHFPGAERFHFTPQNARELAGKAVLIAVEAYKRRDHARVDIPCEPVDMISGFSNEAILGAVGGTPGPLVDAIKAGAIRGAVGIVGCNNPKLQQDHHHVTIARELIRKDILVLVTGCATGAMGKAGLLMPEAAELAGPGLKGLCKALGIPPVLHVGSCVDNSRIIHLCAVLANAVGVDIDMLPVAASAPEWYSEKAAAIGLYAVASGITTHLGLPPMILGSPTVTGLAVDGLKKAVGAAFFVEQDPVKAAAALDAHIAAKRAALGLPARKEGSDADAA
ncbi:MAG: anaerobic carbon-monoxide dehydrogenase catalytic subunit [Deltaproteobacteria bacterium]|jgi:carbon-monoxide dehydrogenase catalytic subunit|nr:anaerobic carbon-monoxide dehydrogenase catalytic subunit [Deltaproteobacteria bacterium]